MNFNYTLMLKEIQISFIFEIIEELAILSINLFILQIFQVDSF